MMSGPSGGTTFKDGHDSVVWLEWLQVPSLQNCKWKKSHNGHDSWLTDIYTGVQRGEEATQWSCANYFILCCCHLLPYWFFFSVSTSVPVLK